MHLSFIVLLTLIGTFPLTWSTKTPLPRALAGSGCAVINDTIYVVGGRDSVGNRYRTLYTYDPVNDQWDSLAQMATARGHVVAAVVNNKLYAFGGWIGGSATNAVEEFDPSTGQWTTKNPMPTARYACGIAVVNDLIYVIGGMDMNSNVYNTVEEYDPATDSWDTKTSMPTARFGPGCAVVRDTIYAFGGSTTIGGGSSAITQCYDPAVDTWTWCTSMNEDRYCVGGFTYSNLVYAVGGYDYYNYHTTVEVYDPVAGSWSFETPMVYPRQSIAVEVVNDCVYVIGGWNNGALSYNEEGLLGIGIKEQQDHQIATLSIAPNPFKSSITIQFQTLNSNFQPTLEIYDISGCLVRTITAPRSHSLVPIIVWDGKDEQGRALPSGTYLLVAEMDDLLYTEKVILVR